MQFTFITQRNSGYNFDIHLILLKKMERREINCTFVIQLF